MDHPGMSIFQGSEALQLDTSLFHLEEDEAEEDQKRWNKELQDIITSEFDDLIDDDDLSTIDSTCHLSAVLEDDTNKPVTSTEIHPPESDFKKGVGSQYSDLKPAGEGPELSEHYQYCFRNSTYEDSNLQYRKADYGSMEELKVLYEVRVREVQQLIHQVKQLKEQAVQEQDKLHRQLVFANAEKEHAVLQNTQSMKNLISSRDRVSELEQELKTLKLNLLNVQQSNLKLSGELDAAHMSVKDLEQKVSLLERSNVANRDTLLRGVQERHEKEITGLRNQLESSTAKLNAKDSECDGLRHRLTDLNRTHEALLVEKTDTINQLMARLEESQRQCQKLMANVDDTVQTSAEKEQPEKYVNQLKMEVDTLRSDLKHYEAMAQFGLLGSEDSDSFRMNSKPQPSCDLNIKLRDELQRCLASLQMKRNEIKQLQNQLLEKDRLIQTMRQQEAVYLAQTDNFKSELTAVKADRYRLEGELVLLRQADVEEKLRSIDQHTQEYIQWHDKAIARVRQEANEQIKALNADFNIRLREAQKESDEVKQLYIEVCSSKDELLATLKCEQKAKQDLAALLDIETDKLRKTQSDLETEHQKLTEVLTFLHSAEEVEELKRALDTEKEKVQDLEVDLQAAQVQDDLYAAAVTEEIERAKMETLQELQFSPKHTDPGMVDRACSPLRDEAGDKEVAKVVAALEAKHQEHLEQVKQESVRCLANELSACEARYQQQLEQAEEEYAHSLAAFQALIISKTQEVEVLKKAMMMERDKLRGECENSQVTEELAVSSKEVKQLKEQLQSCDKEWQARLSAETAKWQARLEEHRQDVETEQTKMAEAVAGWAEELQTLRKRYQESEIRSSELQDKYQAAKKTARRYKLWANGKEQHVKQEWQRIAVGFQNVLQVLQAKAQAALIFTDGDIAVPKELDEQIQALQDQLVQYTPR